MFNFKCAIRENKRLLIFFAIITFIYSLIFLAFGLERFVIIYGLIINIFILLLFLLYDSQREKENNFGKILKSKNLDHKVQLIADEYRFLDEKYKDLLIDYKDMEEATKNFYSLWIHEIKTPLAENRLILAEDNPDIDLLIKNNKRMEAYLDILLGFVRFSSKTNDYIFKEVLIEPLVKNIIKDKSYYFISKNISLDLGDLSYKTITDGKWLSFIISQLINNSLKYSRDAGKIKIYFEDDSLIIEDNGIGIKKSDLARVFEMGYTGENGRAFGSSTGLGLYLVKSIGKDLNLSVSIDSKEGSYTKIAIKFDKLTKL
ncbi:sensor histidine kinase [Anaerococcus sp. Marseille-P3915]|uniref:sensor histidine kinase n=1 Tax=Anaerococcus sp. Marseille-P3915 TaxID=2057799 RepID=UPI000D0BBB70|nr:sensor histidine kinase [Anaerococcus sp. Marseille-P3915]